MVVFIWGLPVMKAFLNGISVLSFPVANLDQVVFRVPPVAPEKKAEAAVFVLNWLSATGTGILVAGIMSGLIMRFSLKEMARVYGETLIKVRFSSSPSQPCWRWATSRSIRARTPP